LGGGDMG